MYAEHRWDETTDKLDRHLGYHEGWTDGRMAPRVETMRAQKALIEGYPGVVLSE